jgi:glycerol-3-phosphate acyltransferase PlsY
LLIDKNELSAGICGAWLAVGIAAVMGHIFPVFLRFKGGKGVATSLGIALGIYPFFTIPAVLSFVVWAVVVLKYRYISLGSVIAAVVFPMFFILSIAIFDGWYLADLWSLLAAGIIIPVMVIIRHRKNITRILNGTESKIKK